MIVEITCCHADDHGKPGWRDRTWAEKHDLPRAETMAQARVETRRIIDEFNKYLRPGEKARRVVFTDWISDDSKKHVWHKSNLVTISDRHGTYDTYRCERCGITGKRHGLSDHISHDKKFQHPKFNECNPK